MFVFSTFTAELCVEFAPLLPVHVCVKKFVEVTEMQKNYKQSCRESRCVSVLNNLKLKYFLFHFENHIFQK